MLLASRAWVAKLRGLGDASAIVISLAEPPERVRGMFWRLHVVRF
jgi:hypothetical protein